MRRQLFVLAMFGLSAMTVPAADPPAVRWDNRWASRVQPVTAPLVYADYCLVVAGRDGVAVIEFHKEVEFGVHYRFRCWDLTTEKTVSGDGRLHDKPQSKDKPETVVRAGPLGLDWSYSAAGKAWVYWWPEAGQTVHFVRKSDFGTLDLKRFVRP